MVAREDRVMAEMEVKKYKRKNSNDWPLYFIVSVSGASILAIELLGTRILAPFYGASIFLWSALISITLAALSVGYAIGGRIADRGCSMRGIGGFLITAGILVSLVPFIRHPVISLLEPLGLRSTVLIATFILFFPCLMILGMISPYSIRLKTSSLEEVGRSAGNLYAVSTIASVFAALLTGFILIPNFGVSRIIFSIGAILFISAGFSFIVSPGIRRRPVAIAALLLAATVASSIFISGSPAADGSPGLTVREQSPYAEISVLEFRDARFLLIDGSIHTFTDAETNEPLFPYVNVLEIARMMFWEPGEALLLGLGGGSVAKNLAEYRWKVEAVEIDPVVTRFASDYFGLEPEEADIHITDGRRFLNSTKKSYDLIIMDAFGSGAIPFHLITKEAIKLVHERLKPGGIVAVNTLTTGWKHRIVLSMAATLKTSFSEVIALPIAEPPNTLGNVVLLAADHPIDIPFELPDPGSRFSAHYDRMHAWRNRFEPVTENALVFTDDRNPIDLWGEQVNLVDREKLRNYFEGAGPIW